jgi:hypothetical protein
LEHYLFENVVSGNLRSRSASLGNAERILALQNWHFSNANQHLIIENQHLIIENQHLIIEN